MEILQCRQLTATVFLSIRNTLRANSGAKVMLYTNSKIKSEMYANKTEEYFDEKGFAGDIIIINGGLEFSEKYFQLNYSSAKLKLIQ